MKILYMTSRFPYPLEKGDKLRAYYQIKALAKNHDIILVSIIDEDPIKSDLEKIRELVKEVYVIRINYIERFRSLIIAAFSGLPFQIAWFYSKNIKQIIHRIANNIQPDHCFCQLTRMAEYCKDLPYPKTLDYMDSFGVGMIKRANLASGISKYMYNIEAARMIRYEESIAKSFDHLTIISQQDKDQFTFTHTKDIHVITNGIDPSFFENSSVKKEFDIAFVGNMAYLPNIEAAEYLINMILPLCPQNVSFLLAGTSPGPRIRKLVSDRVSVSGWMQDIREAYGKANIFCAPLWSGTGQQNKILEAMAMGLPCVTTSTVNNAIGGLPDSDILIADTATQFAEKIDILLNDPILYQKISNNAKIFVKQNFDWKQNSNNLSSIFVQN
ncbi:MAG: glycosyltransferase [Saprospiraceae bacterium]|nr:glycosyltransferase [Saprospiraceae bacterium]